MEHNFYDEENEIVVDSIRRTCGAFDRIRNVQKGISFLLSYNNSLILSFGLFGSESPVIVPLLTFIESNIDSIDINTCHSSSGNTTQRAQKAN